MAHGTSLRGLVKEIENLSDEEVTQLNLPNAIPFVYELDPSTLKPLEAKRFLADEETVKKAVAKVASIQGEFSQMPTLLMCLSQLSGHL